MALIKDRQILVYMRDECKDIPFPGAWDLPGGGREGVESPEECVLRELRQEFGFTMSADRLTYLRRYDIEHPLKHAYFFAAALFQEDVDAICFGDEGQYWDLMDIAMYLAHPKVPQRHKTRLSHYLEVRNEADA